MKKLFKLLMALCITFNIISCKEDDELKPGKIEPIVGGSIAVVGDAIVFEVGDNAADNLKSDQITLSGNEGRTSEWVITDPDGLILGLPESTWA